jgi:hypothetical protein
LIKRIVLTFDQIRYDENPKIFFNFIWIFDEIDIEKNGKLGFIDFSL